MGVAAVDYLRLASWDVIEHCFLLSDYLICYEGEWKPGKWLQYHGWNKPGYFIGTGNQQGKRHSIVNVSGYRADSEYPILLELENYYATRIDLQITIKKPKGIRLDRLYKELVKRDVKSSLIQSELNDTLYVGSRSSDVFTRLYEKPLDEMYLRLEFEFKGKAARGIWKSLKLDATVDEIFQHYLKNLNIPEWVKEYYYEAQDGETAFAIRQEILKTDQNKLDWLNTIDATVRQAIYNDNIGDQVRMLAMSWGSEAANFDNIRDSD